MSTSARPGAVSRRTVTKGAAWVVPVIAVGVAAPSASASTGCQPLNVVIPSGDVSGNPITLTGQGSDGSVYTVTIGSDLASNTVVGQSRDASVYEGTNLPAIPYASYNLTTAGDGWNGGRSDAGDLDFVFTGFGPGSGGAVVLNQRTKTTAGTSDGTVPMTGVDSQTLTFIFAKDGVAFDPTDLSITVFDITSGLADPDPTYGPLGWRDDYWDAVGFSATPTSITYTGTIAAYAQSAGSGTIADPYRRAGSSQPTLSGETVTDVFAFDSFPSGSQMVYSNAGDRHGWHFISISGISFTVGC